MTNLEQAAALLDVDVKFFQPFDVTDPFNIETCRQVCDHRCGMP